MPNNLFLTQVHSIEYFNVITDLLGAHTSGRTDHVTGLQVSLEKPKEDSSIFRALNAVRQKETLLRTYYLRHSFDTFDPMLVNFIIERLGACIAALSTDMSTIPRQQLPDQETLRSTLILCATGLRSQAKSFHVCNLAYLGIQSQMRPRDLQLLLTYVKPPTEAEMPPLDHETVTSWPLPIISMSEDPKKSALSKMVKDYTDLRIRADRDTAHPPSCKLSAICS